MDIVSEIRQALLSMGEEKYRSFSIKLIPNVSQNKYIGVRFPLLRKYASKLYKRQDIGDFLTSLPHCYHEENNLHAFIIANEKDFSKCLELTEGFLPYIESWDTCDSLSPKVFKSHLSELYERIKTWLCSKHTYTIRFGIVCLMRYYLDEEFNSEILELVAGVKSDEYYVNMARAWFFATALTKRYDDTLPYLTGTILDRWTHNKTIRKAIESFCVEPTQKAYLRTLIIK